MKGIRTCNIVLVKHFRMRDIEHWYPIVSIDFDECDLTYMLVFRQGYALVFETFDVKKPCQGMDRQRVYVAEKGMLGKFAGE